MQDLIQENPGITRTEHMEVDSQEVAPASGLPNLPMDMELESATWTFRLDITEPGFTPSLVGSPDSPPSPVTSQEDALLDAPASESPSRNQSKALRSGRLEGSCYTGGMTLRKRKT